MSLALSGFIVFGRQFIILWAGPEYEDAYIICLLFFISLLIPLIQNLGITILQARNQMKFRSLLYVGLAAIAFISQVIFARLWGAVGCAIAVSCALLIGQGLIMNFYYSRKQHIDIIRFWKEILKMSAVPLFMTVIASLLISNLKVNTWMQWISAISVYLLLYLPLFWTISMNSSERDLVREPFRKLFREIKS